MSTLEHWKSRLLVVPSVIECPNMQVIGEDNDPPILAGPGKIEITSMMSTSFTMYASVLEEDEARKRLQLLEEDTYSAPFRLLATDYEGVEWSCGYIYPVIKQSGRKAWLLTGALTVVSTHVQGPWVSYESSVELVLPKLKVPLSGVLGNELLDIVFASQSPEREQTLSVLGSEIRFRTKASDDWFWVTFKTSTLLCHPYAESWITEPFRILLGQLVYPRLRARNFGNGAADVSLRPSPPITRENLPTLARTSGAWKREEFWELYRRLLQLVVLAKDENGNPNFEANPITRFYEEIAQASRGSRWVLCMTLASVGEGLVKMLPVIPDSTEEFDPEKLADLRSLIKSWRGSEKVKSSLFNRLNAMGEQSVGRRLRQLVKSQVLNSDNEKSWNAVRNAVMHGNLMPPWPTPEEDKNVLALIDLVHKLTLEVARQESGSQFSPS